MAYSRVTRTQNGKAALDYAYGHNDKGHNENAIRNQMVSGVNLIDGVPYLEQMQHYWNRARIGHKTQIIRVVQSYSLKEFDPTKVSDIEKAHEIGREFADTYYPNRQAVIFTQIDGKSGLVHNHVLINDVSMEDSKGCDKLQYYFPQIKKWTNEIAGKYIELDFGNGKTEDKTTQTERTKREKGEYVWKDDLKNRIHDTMLESESEQDFEDKLPLHGVNFEKKSSRKYGEGYTYELMDLSNVPDGVKVPKRALKARSRTLGDSYGLDALKDVLWSKEQAKQSVMNNDIAQEVFEDEPSVEIIEDTIAEEVLEDVYEPPEEIVSTNVEYAPKTSKTAIKKQFDDFQGKVPKDEEKPLKMDFTEFLMANNIQFMLDDDFDWALYEEYKEKHRKYLAELDSEQSQQDDDLVVEDESEFQEDNNEGTDLDDVHDNQTAHDKLIDILNQDAEKAIRKNKRLKGLQARFTFIEEEKENQDDDECEM